MRDGSRRIGQDALGIEHKPIMDDRLRRETKLPTAKTGKMPRRDLKHVRVK